MEKIDDELLKKMLEEEKLKKMLADESVEIEYVEPIIEPKVVEIKPQVEEVEPRVEDMKPPKDWKPVIKDSQFKECEAKFGRFKDVCKGIDENNAWVIYFCKDVDLSLFLFTIKSKLLLNPNVTINGIYKEILETSKLTEEVVGKGVRDIVKRYIEYFLAIVKSMQ